MGVIDELSVSVTARTGKLEQGMRRAGKSVDRFSARARSSAASLNFLGGSLRTLVAGASLAGLAALARRSAKATDELTNFAARIGTTVEDLSRLGFVAKQSGVNVKTMQLAMQRFTRRVSEAAIGTGEAQNALQELRLDAAALNRLPLPEKLKIVATAFSNVENAADKVRLAMRLFDTEGVAVVNVLNRGAQGIEELTKEADRFATINSLTARNIQFLESRIANLDSSWDRLSATLTGSVAFALVRIVDTISEMNSGLAEAAFNFTKLQNSEGLIGTLEAGLRHARQQITGVYDFELEAMIKRAEDKYERDIKRFRDSLTGQNPGGPNATIGGSQRDARFLRGQIDPNLIDPGALSRAQPATVNDPTLADLMRQLIDHVQDLIRTTSTSGGLA